MAPNIIFPFFGSSAQQIKINVDSLKTENIELAKKLVVRLYAAPSETFLCLSTGFYSDFLHAVFHVT